MSVPGSAGLLPEDVPAQPRGRAERQAHAEFLRAMGPGVGQDAADADHALYFLRQHARIHREDIVRLVVLAGLVAASTLAPQDPSQPVPRFRGGVDVVLLDVSVLDRDRRPVRGLTAADFTIFEEGRPQPIVSFDELDAPEPDGSLVPWMRDVAPDVRTNTDDQRRIVLIILDDATISFRYRQNVRRIGRTIVDQLGPADQAAVVYTADNRKSQDFTNDRQVLRSVVERYVDTSIPGELRAAYSIGTVRRAVQGLIDIPQRRKALIFVSSVGLSPDGRR